MKTDRSEFFKVQKLYRRGTVHMMNFDRQFMYMHKYFEAESVIGKYRFGLIISDTLTNEETCTVIPIKTDRGGNQVPYETYLPFCVENGTPALLCISQMTVLPIESITSKEIGEVKEDFLEEVYRHVDIHLGRVPSKINSSHNVTQNNEKLLFEAESKGCSPKEPIPVADLLGQNYNPVFGVFEKYTRIHIEEIVGYINAALTEVGASQMTETEIEEELERIGYTISLYRTKKYVMGIKRKCNPINSDFDSMTPLSFQKKYLISRTEYSEIKRLKSQKNNN